jgi:hypothetical protein
MVDLRGTGDGRKLSCDLRRSKCALLDRSGPSARRLAMSANGTKETNSIAAVMSANDPKETFQIIHRRQRVAGMRLAGSKVIWGLTLITALGSTVNR